MDPFEHLTTEEQVDIKLNELEQNDPPLNDQLREKAESRKLQIRSHNGK